MTLSSSGEAVKSHVKTWGRAALFLVIMSLITGVIYTGAVTGIAQVFFPHQANGSIIEVDGKAYGSELVAQSFSEEGHMWGRVMNPNTTTFTDDANNPLLWAGPSNLSPASDDYEALVAERVEALRAAHPEKKDAPVPSDLVTSSGSGIDPDISPAAAEYQVDRLVKETGKTKDEVQAIIAACTEKPSFGVLGQDRVNVLKVNLMLDGILSANK